MVRNPNEWSGNKGEWSEAYVFLRLLSEGRLYSGDENLNAIEDMYYPVLKILRDHREDEVYSYNIQDTDNLVQIYLNDELITEINQGVFDAQADYLYQQIIQMDSPASTVLRTQSFMQEIGYDKLKTPSRYKADIKVRLHDINTGYSPLVGFSIKSELGNAATLINPSKSTNFIYEVRGLNDNQIEEINSINSQNKIIDRVEAIFRMSEGVRFIGLHSNTFDRNLRLIDSNFTELIAHSLIYFYRDGISSCNDVIDIIAAQNPLNFPDGYFYRYKFKKFLCSAALGMTPAKIWDGIDQANGGYILVTRDGGVLAYHIYNRNYFEDYLLRKTKFDKASTTRYDYASLYKEGENTYFKLNLQIRFI